MCSFLGAGLLKLPFFLINLKNLFQKVLDILPNCFQLLIFLYRDIILHDDVMETVMEPQFSVKFNGLLRTAERNCPYSVFKKLPQCLRAYRNCRFPPAVFLYGGNKFQRRRIPFPDCRCRGYRFPIHLAQIKPEILFLIPSAVKKPENVLLLSPC